MQKKQVAVIDVGSSKITAVIGERGLNKTFIIKGRFTYDYDGFEGGVFFDIKKLKQVLATIADNLLRNCSGRLGTVFVGVPGEFTQVHIKESQLSFSKKKKILDEDVDALFDAAFVMPSSKHTLINRSAVVFELDDFRRLANPVGAVSEILSGKLSFIVCSNYFIEAVKKTLEDCGIPEVECVSASLAEALYLVDAETRDRISVIVDVGYITTTFSIIQGDGIMYQESFSFGGGYITAALLDRFNVSYDVAESLKRKINLSCTTSSIGTDTIEGDNGEFYPVVEIVSVVKNVLDGLCEDINAAFEKSGYVIPDYVPLLITGGGISYVRGAKEHLSSRLGIAVDVVAPKVPLMDKPSESAILSLLDLALEQ